MELTPEEESELENIKVAIAKAGETYRELAVAHVAMPGLNAVAKLITNTIYDTAPFLRDLNRITDNIVSEMLRQGFSEVFLAGMEFGRAGQKLSRIPGECDDPNCPGNHARRN